jgi:CrcB protein
MKQQLLLVFLGGGLGSCLRYAITRIYNSCFEHFFLGTFLVNVLGCLLIGFVLGLSFKANYLTPNQTLLLSTGFCGGFTTFSAFALEQHNLLKTGELLYFSLYTLASIILGIVAVVLGLWLARLT